MKKNDIARTASCVLMCALPQEGGELPWEVVTIEETTCIARFKETQWLVTYLGCSEEDSLPESWPQALPAFAAIVDRDTTIVGYSGMGAGNETISIGTCVVAPCDGRNSEIAWLQEVNFAEATGRGPKMPLVDFDLSKTTIEELSRRPDPEGWEAKDIRRLKSPLLIRGDTNMLLFVGTPRDATSPHIWLTSLKLSVSKLEDVVFVGYGDGPRVARGIDGCWVVVAFDDRLAWFPGKRPGESVPLCWYRSSDLVTWEDMGKIGDAAYRDMDVLFMEDRTVLVAESVSGNGEPVLDEYQLVTGNQWTRTWTHQLPREGRVRLSRLGAIIGIDSTGQPILLPGRGVGK